MDFQSFRQGADAYRPLALWSLNHELERDELSRQIGEMADKGMRGFIMHPRSGLLTPYLSERWMQMLGHCIEEAASRGLEAWLYDEDPYPSGICGGRVIADHPEYRAQTLDVTKNTFRGPGRVEMDIPMRRIFLACAVRMENGMVMQRHDLAPSIGILRTRWQEQTALHSYYPTTDSKAMPQQRADTEEPFYRLSWDAPEGDWQILVFHTGPYGKFWLFDSYTDLLNPDAVSYFLGTTYEPYAERFGQWFGTVVPGMFVDEPKFISDPYPWTERLPAFFLDTAGYPIEEALLGLELELADSPARRRDFWDVVGTLFRASYAEPVRDWCQSHGLQLIGHSSPEEEPGDQVVITGDLMAFHRFMDLPGTDLITRMVGDRHHPIVNLGPLLASSTARQWKDGKALCEAFGVMEWRLTIADMAWISTWLFALGVNVISPHAFIYSIDGPRKKDAAPSEFYQAPYWHQVRTWTDLLASLGYLFGDAAPVAQTALVYPFGSFMALKSKHASQTERLRDRFTFLMDFLLRRQVPFELASETDVEEGELRGDLLVIGKRAYRHVVVPPMAYLSAGMRRMIGRMRQAGVHIIAHLDDEPMAVEVSEGENPLPQAPAPAPHEAAAADAARKTPCGMHVLVRQRAGTLDAFSGLADIFRISGTARTGFQAPGLEALLAPCRGDLSLEGNSRGDILLQQACKDGRRVFLLCNTSDCGVALVGRWRGMEPEAPREGAKLSMEREMPVLEAWDVRKGAPTPLAMDGDGRFPIHIPPRGSMVLVEGVAADVRREGEAAATLGEAFRRDAGTALPEPDSLSGMEPIPVGGWRMSPEGRNLLRMDRWVLEKGEQVDPAVIDFRRGLPIVQPSLRGQAEAQLLPAVLWFKTVVRLDGMPDHMGVVLEDAAIRGDYEVYCNGIRCPEPVRTRGYDCRLKETALSPAMLSAASSDFYRNGEVVIAVKVRADSAGCGLLEPLRLYGDFLVALNDGWAMGATLRPRRGMVEMSPGSWTHMGFPHYSGTMRMEARFCLEERQAMGACMLKIDVGGDCAEVEVNGTAAGTLAWEPYDVALAGPLRVGENTLVLRVSNTLENLLYGSGKPAGLAGEARIWCATAETTAASRCAPGRDPGCSDG